MQQPAKSSTPALLTQQFQRSNDSKAGHARATALQMSSPALQPPSTSVCSAGRRPAADRAATKLREEMPWQPTKLAKPSVEAEADNNSSSPLESLSRTQPMYGGGALPVPTRPTQDARKSSMNGETMPKYRPSVIQTQCAPTDVCMSSMHWCHANTLRIVPIVSDATPALCNIWEGAMDANEP